MRELKRVQHIQFIFRDIHRDDMKLKKLFFTLIVLILLLASWLLWRLSYIANGYTSKYLCSLAFNSGLDPEVGFDTYVKPMHVLFAGVVPEIDREHKTVTSRYFGFLRPRKAVWREGCGCTLLVDQTEEELRSRYDPPSIDSMTMAMKTSAALWPEGQAVSRDSMDAGIRWSAIDSILDRAMEEHTDDPHDRWNTLALVVAWKGRIIGERYAPGVHEDTPLLGWSAAKSITGSLTGVMVQKHGLDITLPVGLPEWVGDERKEITINHLLRMESGLDFEENYAPFADATEMLYASTDMGHYAAMHPLAAGPGERWAYSSGTSNILADVLYDRMGGTPGALHHLAYQEFFNRLGITTAIFEHDESDAFVGSSYLYMSARDWLRVCKLYMDNGIWNGEQILPEGWVKYALTPTPHATDSCYGAQIWLNAAADPSHRRCPGLPADAFFFRGFQGQWIVGIPSKGLMLARLGVTQDDQAWSPEEVIGQILNELEK